MAAGSVTIGQLVQLNNRNMSGAFMDELLESARLVAALSATTASHGTKHEYLQYDDPPPVGYRALNDGIVRGHPTDTPVPSDLEILDASFDMDINAARVHPGGESQALAFQSTRHLRTAFAKLEAQIIYGTTTDGDAAGHIGMANQIGTLGAVDLTGRTRVVNKAGIANLTSVWLIRSASSFTDTALVLGQGGNIMMGEPYKTNADGSGSGTLTKWAVDVSAYYGFQQGAIIEKVRICNIDVSDPTNFTDADIAAGLRLFPADRPCTHIVMNTDAQYMLQSNRTATNPQGTPAPFPESAFNRPIVLSDNISSSETAVA